jgi:hypothetical protein
MMNAIKAGIITKTTKSTLERLEQEQESHEVAIAKEKIERPTLSKEQIRFWIMKFATIDIDYLEQKQRLINAFVNSVYVYDDKMLITFNYKDGEKCLSFEEVDKTISKKKNPVQHKVKQSSSLLALPTAQPII